MRRGRSTGNKTAAENAWFDLITTHGCVCCIHLGFWHDPNGYRVEQHHFTSGGIRVGHMASCGLCIWHHRGRILIPMWSLAQHRENLGPSLSEGRVPFEERFGDEQWLAERQVIILESAGAL